MILHVILRVILQAQAIYRHRRYYRRYYNYKAEGNGQILGTGGMGEDTGNLKVSDKSKRKLINVFRKASRA